MNVTVWFLKPDWSDPLSTMSACYQAIRHPGKPLFSHVVLTLEGYGQTWIVEYGAFGLRTERLQETGITFERAKLRIVFNMCASLFQAKLTILGIIRKELGDRKLRPLDFITNAPTCTSIASLLFRVPYYGRRLTPVQLAEALIDMGGEPYET